MIGSGRMKCVSAGSASIAGCTGGARLLDLCNPLDILDLQVTAAFENFQRVFFVSEAQPLGFFDAERDDAGRGVFPGRAMRRLPVKVISNSAVAPFRRVLSSSGGPPLWPAGAEFAGLAGSAGECLMSISDIAG